MSAMAALAIVSFPACKKEPVATPKPETAPTQSATPSGNTPVTPPTTPAVTPETPKPAIAAEEIAAMIGQGADLPKDFETLTLIDAGQIKTSLKGTAIWKEAREAMGLSESDLPEDAKPSEGGAISGAAIGGAVGGEAGEPQVAGDPDDGGPVGVGTEFAEIGEILTSGKIVIATGPGTGTQTMQLLQLMGLVQRISFRESLESMAEDAGLLEAGEPSFENPFSTVLKDRFDQVLGLLEQAEQPLVYISLEAKGKEDKIKAMLAEWDGDISTNLPPFVQKTEVELGGGKFVTFTVKAQDTMSLEDLKESMSEDLPVDKIEKLHAALAKKQMTLGFGLRKESLVFFLSPTPDGLKFVESPAESMAARPEFELLGEAKGKSPFFVSMASQKVSKGLRDGSDNTYVADVFNEVLGKVKGLGDLRDVVALVEKAGVTIGELSKGKDSEFCAAGWMENGVRFEALGGAESPDLDGSQPLAFADALGSEDTVLTLNTRSNPVYTAKLLDLLEDLSEIAYELGHRYASSDAGKEAGMNEQFQLFHEKMLPHATAIWKSLRGKVGQATGQEAAMVMDLGAPIPKFPGLPEALTKGRVPRMAVVYQVVNRALLAEGWQEMEPALKGLLAALPLPEDQKINLPDPTISEKESLGLKTYSYPVSGFTNDDFLPAISISDKFFFLSSSKNFSEMLAGKLAAAQPNPAGPRGLVMEVRFAPVVKTALEWLNLAKDNAASVFPNDSAREEFLGEEPQIRKALGWVDGMDSMSLRRAPEGSKWRTSMHFKLKAKN